jgi:hypothetical protein
MTPPVARVFDCVTTVDVFMTGSAAAEPFSDDNAVPVVINVIHIHGASMLILGLAIGGL